jgi:IclR family mhp operon transcriptional activator
MAEAAGMQRDQVKALGKGLQVLAELNRCNGLSVSDVSQRVRMPRPTVARIITTLEAAGYVYQCPADSKYRVTAQVRRLTRGYSTSRWLRGVAEPVAEKLARRLAWPAMVARTDQRGVKLICLTDTRSTVLVERRTLGEDISLLGSALGLSFLAFGAEDPVEHIIHATRREGGSGGGGDAQQRIRQLRHIEELIEISRSRGYVCYELPDKTAFAAPILHEGRMVAAIGVRIPLPIAQLAPDRAEICAAVCEAAGEISGKLA